MKLLKTFLMLAFSACLFSSCLSDDDESENTYTAFGYYTITGSMSSGYTLYSDAGGKVIPTAESVANITNSVGFGDHTRALLYFQYKPSQISADQKTITGASLYDGRYLEELYPMTIEEANESLVTSSDSIFQITEFMEAWAYRGYVNTVVNGVYSVVNDVNIKPTVNIVYDPASIRENAITFDIYYNRHSAQNATANGPVYFYTSYYLNEIEEDIPGSGDVTVTINCDNGISKTLTVSRENFHKGNYE